MSMLDDLRWRGLVFDVTPGLEQALAAEKLVGYIGFDPSAASLHVGSLLPIMALARFQRAGHTPIAIAGGGTGLIGDPSGKTVERQLLTGEQVEQNLVGIKAQLARLLDFEAKDNPARIVNNADWLVPLRLVDFLRDVGKHFSVNVMLARESVKKRLESQEGISFTEFSYQLLQAYDFLELFDRYGCSLQMGGSDQWGNIVAGADLIRRLRGGKAWGLVFPLVTNAAGTKFGKTEAGTVWLDPQLTTPYRFYQFWLNTDDKDVVRYLKYFTWLGRDEVSELEAALSREPELRSAQRRLAEEVTRLVHGEAALAHAEQLTGLFFGGNLGSLSAGDVLDVLGDSPVTELPVGQFSGEGMPLVELLVTAKVAPSKSEARRLIEGGGIYVGEQTATDVHRKVTAAAAIDGEVLVLRKGKKSYHVVRLAGR
jgi:tyrosyl-tRNA synthetase